MRAPVTTWTLTLRTITGRHLGRQSDVADTPAAALQELVDATAAAAAGADGAAVIVTAYLDGHCIGAMNSGADVAAHDRLERIHNSGRAWIARTR